MYSQKIPKTNISRDRRKRRFTPKTYILSLKKNYFPNICYKLLKKIFLYSYVVSYIGARVFSILIESQPKSIAHTIKEIIKPGSMTLYGGLSVGLLFSYVYLKVKKELSNRKKWHLVCKIEAKNAHSYCEGLKQKSINELAISKLTKN